MDKKQPKIKNLKKLRPRQLRLAGQRGTGYAGAAKIILKMHCPKKGRNTHGHSHTHTLGDFKPSHDEQKKKTKKIKNVIIKLKLSA